MVERVTRRDMKTLPDHPAFRKDLGDLTKSMEIAARHKIPADASVSCKPRFFPRLCAAAVAFSAFQFVIETPPEPLDSEAGAPHCVFEPLG